MTDKKDINELPLGNNADELRFDNGTEEIFIPYDGGDGLKKWRFVMRKSLSFGERNKILASARGKDNQMDYDKFLIQVAETFLVEAPFPVNKLQLQSLDPAFADMIYLHLPINQLLEEDALTGDERKNLRMDSPESPSETDIPEQ